MSLNTIFSEPTYMEWCHLKEEVSFHLELSSSTVTHPTDGELKRVDWKCFLNGVSVRIPTAHRCNLQAP